MYVLIKVELSHVTVKQWFQVAFRPHHRLLNGSLCTSTAHHYTYTHIHTHIDTLTNTHRETMQTRDQGPVSR